MSDLRTDLIADLAAFGSKPLSAAARAFFKTLGYQSDRTLPVGSVDAFCRQFDSEGRLDHPSAMKSEWRSIHLLFQLTDQELSKQNPLFKNTSIQKGLFESYIFFALELKGSDYARSKFTAIARQLNRLFPMPVMVFFKHLRDNVPSLPSPSSTAAQQTRRRQGRSRQGHHHPRHLLRPPSPRSPRHSRFADALPISSTRKRSRSPTSTPSTRRGSRFSTSNC